MTWSNGKLPASFSQRCRSLSVAARAVRERAVVRGYDLDGWRLSRLMREANTDAQVNVAELEFSAWLRANPLQEQEALASRGDEMPGRRSENAVAALYAPGSISRHLHPVQMSQPTD